MAGQVGMAIAAAVGGIVGTGTGAIIATTAAYYAGVGLTYAAGAYLLNTASEALTPDPKGGSPGGVELNYVGTYEPRRIIYGEIRAGGMQVIPPIATGNDGKFLHMIIAHAGHECHAIDDVFFDDDVIASADIGAVSGTANDGLVGGTGTYKDIAWIRRYTGTSTQTADYILTQADPTVFDADFRGRGITYTAVQLKWAGDSGGPYKSGVPNVSARIRGKKCYDPRTATTYWVANPALAVRDFLVNHVGFSTAQIDDTLVIASANVCDQAVAIPGSTAPRYTCNVLLEATEDWREVVKKLVDCMRGRIVFRDGKWRIYAGAWEVPTITINQRDWVGPTRVQASAPMEDRWNAVRTWYIDRNRNYQRVESFPRRNTTYETDDGDRIWKELDVPGCNTEYEAQRHGELCLRASRNQLKIIGRLKPEFVKLATWEPVSLNDTDYNWSSKTFRVFSMDMTPTGEVDVVLVEEGSASWTDLAAGDYDNVITWPTVDPGASLPSARTGFVTNGNPGAIEFAWNVTSDAMPGEMSRIVEYTSSGYAHLGTELWRGAATRVNVQRADTTTRYYWVQGVVGSYTGPYTPNTYGTPMGAESGGTGAPGEDGVAVALSLPAVTLPADVAGTVIDYAAANGALTILRGGVDVTTYSATRASSQAGVTGTVNSADDLPWTGQPKGRYRVTACTSNIGVLWCEAVYSGTTYVRPFVVSKARTGSSGLDAIVGWLSNEAASIPASSNGYVADWLNAEGLFRVYHGVSSVSGSATFSVTSEAGCTAQINTAADAPVAGKVRGYYRVTAVTSDIGVAHLRAVYGGVTIDKEFTVTKALGGIAGTNANTAATLDLIATGQQFRYSGSGTNIGVSTIGFDALLQNVGGTAGFRANNYRADGTMISSYALAGAGNTNRGLHINSFAQAGSTAYAIVTASLAPGLYDQVSVIRVAEGASGADGLSGDDALIAYLTNENHTLAASYNGYVPSYAGAAGAFVAMLGVTSIVPGSMSYAVNSNPQNLTNVFSTNGTFAVTGGFDIGEDQALLYLRGTYAGTMLEKVFTLGKSKAGAPGPAGFDALTAYLTNEAVVLPASSNGYVPSYTGADGRMVLMWGVTSVNANSITFAVGSNPQNLTNVFSVNGTYRVTAGFDAGEDTAALWLRGTYDSVAIDRAFTLGKAKGGIPGEDGVGGTLRYIHAHSGSVIYNSIGTVKLEAYALTASNAAPITTGSIQLYIGNTVVSSANGFDASSGSNGFIAVLDASDIGSARVVSLRGPGTIEGGDTSEQVTQVGSVIMFKDYAPSQVNSYLGYPNVTAPLLIVEVTNEEPDGGTVDDTFTIHYAGVAGTKIGNTLVHSYNGLSKLGNRAFYWTNSMLSGQTKGNTYSLVTSNLGGNNGVAIARWFDNATQVGSIIDASDITSTTAINTSQVTITLPTSGHNVALSRISHINFITTHSWAATVGSAMPQGYALDAGGAFTAYGATGVTSAAGSVTYRSFLTDGGRTLLRALAIAPHVVPAGESSSATIYDTMTVLNVEGGTASMMRLLATGQAFHYDGAGLVAGVSTIGFEAVLENLAGTAGFYANNYRSDGTLISSYNLSGTGNANRGLHVNSFTQAGSTAYAMVVASLTGGYHDQITVVRLQQGTDALVAYLTNESHVLPSSSNGYVPSYVGANGRFVMMLGTNSVNVGSITFAVNSNPQNLTNVFSTNGTYAVTGGLDLGEDYATLWLRGTYDSKVVDKGFTIAKAVAGPTGATGDDGVGQYTMTAQGAGTIVFDGPDAFHKSAGGAFWNASAYSNESFYGGAYLSFKCNETTGLKMMALNAAPSDNADYTSLDYAFYFASGIYIYEDGSQIGGSLGSFTTSDVFAIQYDGKVIRYIKNDTVLYSHAVAGAIRTLHMDSSIYTDGNGFNTIRFSNAGPAGADGLSITINPSAVSLPSGPTGAILSGLPQTVTAKLFSGTTDVSTSATWTFAQSNLNVSNDGNGVFTVSGLVADTGYLEVTATYNSMAMKAQCTFSKSLAGNTPGILEDTSITINTGTSYSGTQGGPLTLTVGPNGTININVYHNFEIASGTGTRIAGSVQYRTTPGSGGWTTIGAEALSSTAIVNEPGSLSFSRSIAGPGSVTQWEFQYIQRKYSGTGTPATWGDNSFVVMWA